MSSSGAIFLAVVCLVLGLVVGAVVGYWLRWRQGAGMDSGEQSMRAELAVAQTRAELLDRELNTARQQQTQDQQLLRILGPIGKQLDQMGHQVNQLEQQRVSQYGQLAEQLRTAAETDTALLTNTQALLSTLKSHSARGHWGEVQLRRIVEAAGMLDRTDFTEQAHIRDSEGNPLRPDMVIYLPGDKTLAVDAKAPLSAILRADDIADDGTDETRQLLHSLEVQHAKDVRKHVSQLAKKKYWTGLENSPELVICFLPAESYLSVALKVDPALLDDAFTAGVALVSPVSLLAALKSVAYSWQQEILVDNARLIFDNSRKLYQRVSKVGEHIHQMGRELTKTVNSYNQTVASLETRFLPAAREIHNLDVALPHINNLNPIDATPRELTAPELLPDSSQDPQ